jgi:hypothetical protein
MGPRSAVIGARQTMGRKSKHASLTGGPSFKPEVNPSHSRVKPSASLGSDFTVPTQDAIQRSERPVRVKTPSMSFEAPTGRCRCRAFGLTTWRFLTGRALAVEEDSRISRKSQTLSQVPASDVRIRIRPSQ